MGLDNIPKEYPCKRQGTAILDEDGKIDCKKTIAAGKCPHDNMKNNNPLLKDAIIPLGMFGTNCWYRGKYGAYLLEQMANHINDFEYDENTLYGHEIEDDIEGLSSEECIDIADEMSAYSEAWVQYVKTNSEVAGDPDRENDLINDWVYLAAWLRFAGKECNGVVSWY